MVNFSDEAILCGCENSLEDYPFCFREWKKNIIHVLLLVGWRRSKSPRQPMKYIYGLGGPMGLLALCPLSPLACLAESCFARSPLRFKFPFD